MEFSQQGYEKNNKGHTNAHPTIVNSYQDEDSFDFFSKFCYLYTNLSRKAFTYIYINLYKDTYMSMFYKKKEKYPI